ncbi:porin [Brevundimonas sp. M20]|uniref:porin n=1 Tax=Brevundimonas sp. M20 TaxID=2591463 RepID=UPI0011465B7A|nr:porin [Brevundimonas sp. M20]QDH72924.1 porin [Brevundimonas sp. M20]
MKTLFLATAAVAAFAAAPAFAQDAVGSVGIGYNNVKYDAFGSDFTAENGKVDVAAAIPVTGPFTVTLDGGFSYNNNAVAGQDNSSVDGAVHGTVMINDTFRVGGFTGGAEFGDDTLWAFGAEAQAYINNMTLTGSVAYETADDADIDAWSVGGDVAYFITPALRVNGGLGWHTVDGGGSDIDVWSINAGGEYQIADTPFSLTANYGYAELEDVDLSINTLTVGLRYTFGGDLQTRSRLGADLGRTAASVGALAGAF